MGPGHQTQAVLQQLAPLFRLAPFFQQGRCLQKVPVVPGLSLTQQGRQIGPDAIELVFRMAAGCFLLVQRSAQAGLFCGTLAGVLRSFAQHLQLPEPVGILR